MPAVELTREGQHVMTVCNACRYCEGYCPVFQAMEERRVFAAQDLAYLANLCHNCGECLYACQYAPPHEFGINVPRTLAETRLASYEQYCWPAALGRAFRRQPAVTTAAVMAGLLTLLVLVRVYSGDPAPGAFYQVLPHHVMVALFSAAALFASAAIVIAAYRFRRDVSGPAHAAAADSSGRRRPDGAAEIARGL